MFLCNLWYQIRVSRFKISLTSLQKTVLGICCAITYKKTIQYIVDRKIVNNEECASNHIYSLLCRWLINSIVVCIWWKYLFSAIMSYTHAHLWTLKILVNTKWPQKCITLTKAIRFLKSSNKEPLLLSKILFQIQILFKRSLT